jgi:hypothetical protein
VFTGLLERLEAEPLERISQARWHRFGACADLHRRRIRHKILHFWSEEGIHEVSKALRKIRCRCNRFSAVSLATKSSAVSLATSLEQDTLQLHSTVE